MKSKQLKGTFFILIASLMYGSYGMLSRWVSNYGIYFQIYIRSFLIVALLLIVGLIGKKFRKIDREDVKWFVVINLFTVFSIAPITFAFGHLDLNTSSFLFYSSYIIFAFILGLVFFKEKVTWVKSLSFILACIGLFTIFSIQFQDALILPVIMAILTGLAVGGESIFSKKVSQKYSNTQITLITYLVIGISHLIMSLVTSEGQNFADLSGNFIFIIIVFAIISVVSSMALIEGYKNLEPSIGSIIGLTEILFSVMFAVIVFNETLGINNIIGGVVIIIAAALPNIVELRHKPNP